MKRVPESLLKPVPKAKSGGVPEALQLRIDLHQAGVRRERRNHPR